MLYLNNWENSVSISKDKNDGEDSKHYDEYLIIPYTSFKLNKIPKEFKYINNEELDEDKRERFEDAKQYEMTLSKEPFYRDDLSIKWFEFLFSDSEE